MAVIAAPSAVGSSNISGISSGIDWNTIVDKLMAVEGKQITQLQLEQANETSRQNALNTLNTQLNDFSSAAIALADSTTFFNTTTALTSDNATAPASLMSVTTDGTAGIGTHTVQTTQLATAEKFTSSGAIINSNTTAPATSSSEALGLAGTFQIMGQANTIKTITISATDSLQNIVNSINNENTGTDPTKVTASILQVGSSDFRLVMTADDTGTTKGMTNLTDVGSFLLNSLNIDTIAPSSRANDANLTVDGIAVVRESNVITDLLPGMTLSLLALDTAATMATVTITTSRDNATIISKIQSFADSYNTVVDFINQQMSFDLNTGTGGPLAGDSIVRSLQSSLATNITASIPSLASDRNSLVLIGVAPNDKGQLVVDNTVLDSFLNSDPNSVRKLFAATGTGSNTAIGFIDYGANTVSGSYTVNISQTAAQATITGTTNLSAGISAGSTSVTITDGGGQQASLTLGTTYTTLASIVNAMNTEFANTHTEKRKMSTALVTGAGTPANAATTLANLTDGASNSLGVATGDTIKVGGTNRFGIPVNYTFSVLDPTTDTVGDLLTAIQVAFDQQVTASLDSSGNINIIETTDGGSSVSLAVTANNEGGGGLAFGSDTLVTEGRYAMNLTAAASGNFLQISSDAYGASTSFSVLQSTNKLGMANTTLTGKDVAGTIGGFSTTTSSQVLYGNISNVEGLAISYSGTTSGNVGTIDISLGAGPFLDNLVQTYTDTTTGSLQNSITSSQDGYKALQKKIDDLKLGMDMERARLLKGFKQMEALTNKYKGIGSWLTQITQPAKQ